MSSSTASHVPFGHVIAEILRSIAVHLDRPAVAKPAKVTAPNDKRMARRGVNEDGGHARSSFLTGQSSITDHTARLQNFR
jgi:hypothetical protein